MNGINFKDVQLGPALLRLLPQRAVWWESARCLFVSDLHLGKESTFRRRGSAVPDLTQADLERLQELIQITRCRTLWILGDFFHGRLSEDVPVRQTFASWRNGHPNLEVNLVRGNHDLHAGDPPSEWNIDCVTEPFQLDGIALRHHPDFSVGKPTLAGHLHPKFRIKALGDELRLPGFLLRDQCLVLPSFASFIDHGLIKAKHTDQLFPIAEDHVFQYEPNIQVR